MSYGRHDDGHDGGGYRGGRGGGRGGRGGGREHQTFDGKHQRKPVTRRTIDYNAPLIHHALLRYRVRDWRDLPGLQTTSDSIREMDAVIDGSDHNPSLGICTRYVGLAVNKVRAPITAMTWFPEGRRLLTGAHSGEMTQWSGHQFNFEGIVALAHDEPIRAMQWSHSGQLLLTADEGGVVKYWQHTLNNLKAFKAHPEPVRDLTFSPSDAHFASCSDDQTCSVWDVETQVELLALKGHGYDVKAVKWHPSKGLLASGSKDALIKLWDPRAGTGGHNNGKNAHCIADLHFHKNTVNRLAWSPLNPHWLASGSRDNLVKLYDLRTMKDFQTGRHAHAKDSKSNKEVTSLTWHPSIERLFASGSNDGTIHKWMVGETDGSVAEITGAHDSAVFGLEWHPLGHLLASASNDHTTRFWSRNRPGDDMTDKYNVSQLPDAQKVEAVRMLTEGVMKNPSKYSRLHASLAEFAEPTPGEGQAPAPSSYRAPGTAEIIPGMGLAAPVSTKPEPVAGSSVKLEQPPAAFAGYNPPPSTSASTPAYAGAASSSSSSYDRSSRRRSRSRSRDRERPSRYAPPAAAGSAASSSASGAGYNNFFSGAASAPAPLPPPPHPHSHAYPPPPAQQKQHYPPPQPSYGAYPPPQQMQQQAPYGTPYGQQQPPQQHYPQQQQQQQYPSQPGYGAPGSYGQYPPQQQQPYGGGGYGAYPPPPPQQQQPPPPHAYPQQPPPPHHGYQHR